MSPDEPDEDFLKLSSQVILSQCKLIFKTELVIDYKKKALKKKRFCLNSERCYIVILANYLISLQ